MRYTPVRKKRNLSEPRQAWLDYLEEHPNCQQALSCFQARGLATQDQIEKLTPLTEKQARQALNEMRHAPAGLPALLETRQASLQGQRGRPQQLHLLTVDGHAVCRALNGEAHRSTTQLADPVELAHAFIEMEIFTLASISKLGCEIEQVLPYQERANIRADVVVDLPSEKRAIFEVEQVARINDGVRIADKLERMRAFFLSDAANGIDRNIRVLFNLPANDSRSLEVWQSVQASLIEQLGPLPFQLHWQPVLDFLKGPAWETLEGFAPLAPAVPADKKGGASLEGDMMVPTGQGAQISADLIEKALLPAFVKEVPANLKTIDLVFGALAKSLQGWFAEQTNAQAGRGSFFLLMRSIYEASHYPNGPVMEYAALPVLSLVLLHRYLHMHQNERLLEIVQRSLGEVHRSQAKGINLFRDAFTRMTWEFLRYHGLGRGGPLSVLVVVPGFDSERSEIFLDVSIRSRELIIDEYGVYIDGDTAKAETALAWVIEALWTYSTELEINGRPGKGKNAGK